MPEYEPRIELGEVRKITRHMHRAIEIFFLLRGEVDFELDATLYRMRQDDIILCNQGEIRAATGAGPNILLRLLLPGEFLKEEAGITSGHVFNCNSVAEPEKQALHYFELKRTVTRLMLAHFQPGEQSRLEVKTTLLRLLGQLLTAFRDDGRSASVSAGSGGNDRIQPVLQYIHEHYADNLSLQGLADREHLSVHYLSRLFKQRMGVGFLEYLNQVRLRNAVDDLLYTKDPVLKVALNNGFSGAAAFNRLFQRTYYGETPARFRAKRSAETRLPDHADELVTPESFGTGEELVKYLRQFDVKYQSDRDRQAAYTIDMNGSLRGRFHRIPKILRAGRICELLKAEVRGQLEALVAEMGIGYVHFRCLFGDGIYPYGNTVYAQYEYDQIFDYLSDLGVIPVLALDANEILREIRPDASFETVSAFLHGYVRRFGAAAVGKWRFEVIQSGRMDPGLYFTLYKSLCDAIHRSLPKAAAGIGYNDSLSGESIEALADFLRRCEAEDCPPQFLGLYVDPALHPTVTADEDFVRFRHFNTDRVRHLKERLSLEGIAPIPLVLMDWNTLSGYTTAESNTFYRGALIMDELVELTGEADAVAVWLNTYLQEAATGKDDFSVLSLYLYKGLKRPIHFTLELLDKLRDSVLYHDDALLATRGADGTWALLAFNPCYFNPRYASDDSFADSQTRKLTLTLENLTGSYIFERYHVDQGQGAIYDRWAKMGFPSLLNRSITEYLQKYVSLDYSMFEEHVEGRYDLQLNLRFNAAVIYLIRPA